MYDNVCMFTIIIDLFHVPELKTCRIGTLLKLYFDSVDSYDNKLFYGRQ